eukprot:scaffold73237_cov14-Prasinocladus_malaysianus.AAC.3
MSLPPAGATTARRVPCLRRESSSKVTTYDHSSDYGPERALAYVTGSGQGQWRTSEIGEQPHAIESEQCVEGRGGGRQGIQVES